MNEDSPTREKPSDSLFYLGSTAAQIAAGLVVLPAVARLLGYHQFGLLVLVLSGVRITATLGPLGTPQRMVAVFATGVHRGDIVRMARGAAVSSIPAAVVLVIVLLLWEDIAVSPFVALGAGAASFMLGISSVSQTATRLAGQAGPTALGLTLVGPAAISVGALAAWRVAPTVLAFVIGYLCALMVGACYSAVKAAASINDGLVERNRPKAASSLLSAAALFLTVHAVMMTLLNVADRFVVAWTLGPDAVGEYHLAYQLLIVLAAAVVAVANGWSPHLVRIAGRTLDGSRSPRPDRFAVPQAAYAFAVIGLVAAVWGSDALVFFRVIESPLQQAAVVPLLAASALPFHYYLVQSYVSLSRKEYREVALASSTGVIVNVALSLVLVHPMGLAGVALATLLAYITLWLMLSYCGSARVSATEVTTALGVIAGTVGVGIAAQHESRVVIELTVLFAALVAGIHWIGRGGFSYRVQSSD